VHVVNSKFAVSIFVAESFLWSKPKNFLLKLPGCHNVIQTDVDIQIHFTYCMPLELIGGQLAVIWAAILDKGTAVKRVKFGAGVVLELKELLPSLVLKDLG
jgi:hypothetical protein